MLRCIAGAVAVAAFSGGAFVLVAVAKPGTRIRDALLVSAAGIVVVAVELLVVCGPIGPFLNGRRVPRSARLAAGAGACILTAVVLQVIVNHVFGDASDPTTLSEYAMSWVRRPVANCLALGTYALPAVMFLFVDRAAPSPGAGQRTTSSCTEPFSPA